MSTQQSAPYRPEIQSLGGTPTKSIDIPICAVFLALYMIIGGFHQATFIKNKKSGRKFLFNGMMFGLCSIRFITLSLRIAWSCYNTNIKLGIAAQIFTNIGVVLLYFVNLFFTQRIVRAQHPHFGWTFVFNPLIPFCCAITVLTIIALIVALIQSFYTRAVHIHNIDRIIELYGTTAFTVIAFIPFLIISISCLARLVNTKTPVDKFGSGKMRTKIALVLSTSALLTITSGIKAGTQYYPPTLLVVPNTSPATPNPIPWYLNRGIFYGFGFSVEIVILYLYMGFRVDKRFIIPNGAHGAYSYAGGFVFAGESGNEKRNLGQQRRDSSTRNLTGASQMSLQSLGGSTKQGSTRAKSVRSLGRNSVVSWGGISVGNVRDGVGEDGVETVPYLPPGLDGSRGGGDDEEIRIGGAEEELGWDAKSGQWKLRPISHVSRASRSVFVTPVEHV